HGKAVRVWMRRPWFSSGDDEQLGVVLDPAVRLPRGWTRQAGFQIAPHIAAQQPPRIILGPLRRTPRPAAGPPGPGLGPPGSGQSQVFTQASGTVSETLSAVAAGPTLSPDEATQMIKPYTTSWGLDPVWDSALPDEAPTVAAFPRHSGYASGLTLDELPA